MRAIPVVTTFSVLLATIAQLAQSTPVQLDENVAEEDIIENTLEERSCSNPCGYYSQLCCTSSQTCTTNSLGQAECVAGSAGSTGSGSWQFYTTTFTETNLATVTSVYSSYITAAPTSTATCAVSLGESVCGTSCCSAEEICDNGVCVAGSSTDEAATGTASPAVRPTSSGAETVTATASATTTVGFIAPVGTNGATVVAQASGGHGLSGGAIAGIVIGVIAGVFLLILLCACLCIRGVVDTVLGMLGLRSKKRRDTTYVEERISHHSHGAEPARRTWFGTRPSRPDHGEKKSGFGTLAWLAVIAGAVALCLGLRRRNKEEEKSEYSYGPGSSYYTYYSYDASESELIIPSD
ncbi:hypothetical protein BGW36DRAFT_359265 [Talaromyces proteolyticus]|uniref:Mid2 domain-containing protein n=1 Tax=Talaromyces proteolyticus TaxID=1131652 RepID=A0AAD4KPH3_9EURO|nr:uncharacterized protein BGW36DRAFT_359265 [Talaromyces proteolyticus]KAH8697477.1 hypothetical protein BGW36DRAFT_359265 [Talaromyces proteolyticus]